jgi:hypothetical protein
MSSVREAVVAQGWKRLAPSEHPRTGAAQEARLTEIERLAFHGELARAARILARTPRRRRGDSAAGLRSSSGSRAARSSARLPDAGSTVHSELSDEYARWLGAYIACARGALSDAVRACRRLAGSPDPLIRARAAATAGSALRQSRRYGLARQVESAALRTAPPSERVHLLIGLAADAVGEGDEAGCARLLRRAVRALPPRAWRARVRLDWVRCEHALLTGDPEGAARFARASLVRSRRAGARRHEAKSLLFLGVSLRAGGRGGEDAVLRDAARIAAACGAAELASVATRVGKG